mmetsp:Transcript_42383/g.105903  ORF Transcript_42383/g.105903 Transcript_42383/m.105903 type:complete len:155 (+) Transcript_42383:86-550(+)
MARLSVAVLLLALLASSQAQDFDCLDAEAEAILMVAAMRSVLPEAECMSNCGAKWCDQPIIPAPATVTPAPGAIVTTTPLSTPEATPAGDAPLTTTPDGFIPCTDPAGCFGGTTPVWNWTTPSGPSVRRDYIEASEDFPPATPVPASPPSAWGE